MQNPFMRLEFVRACTKQLYLFLEDFVTSSVSSHEVLILFIITLITSEIVYLDWLLTSLFREELKTV